MPVYRNRSTLVNGAVRRRSPGVVLALGGLAVGAACVGGTAHSSAAATTPIRAAASPSGQSCAPKATKLTFWSWVPGIQRNVTLFNKTHPGICVQLDDVGTGTTELEKLAAAFKAGSGAPDVVQLQGISAAEFFSPTDLVNVAQYGANAFRSQFYKFAWARLQNGNATYCVPQDIGPMAMLYNTAFFQHYHISVPTTWAQFATDAAKVHAENAKVALTDFPTNDPNWTFGLMAQKGAYQFGPLHGTTLPVHIDNAPAKAFAQYWQPLITRGDVQSVPDFTTDFYRELGDGSLGVWLTAAWGPDDFSASLAGPSLGKWRVAPLPQWRAGANAQADWGGSCDAVSKQSANPKAATQFALWLNTNAGSWKLLSSSPTDLYPSLPKIATSKSFLATKLPLTGNQQIYRVFAKAATHLSGKELGSPIETYVFTEYTDDTGNGHTPLAGVLSKLQAQSVSYARQVGLHVVG